MTGVGGVTEAGGLPQNVCERPDFSLCHGHVSPCFVQSEEWPHPTLVVASVCHFQPTQIP